MIAQTTEKPAFSAEQIAAVITRHKLKPTSQFTAEQIAVKCLEAQARGLKNERLARGTSRRFMRSHRYGDCHWAGK